MTGLGSIIENGLSVFEQVQRFNTRHLLEHELKTMEHYFQFPRQSWDQKCEGLSGGEKLKLALCCLAVGTKETGKEVSGTIGAVAGTLIGISVLSLSAPVLYFTKQAAGKDATDALQETGAKVMEKTKWMGEFGRFTGQKFGPKILGTVLFGVTGLLSSEE